MRPLLALGLFAAYSPAAPVPKAVKKGDVALIVGTWKPAASGTCHYQFRDDGTMRTWHTPEVGPPIDWTYTLDPTASPKGVKLTSADGKSYDCVYELDGDRLKLAFLLGAGKLEAKWETTPGLQLYEQTRDTSAK